MVAIGDRFNRLVVVGEAIKGRHGIKILPCVCDCGNELSTTKHKLMTGHTKSCGCLKREYVIERNGKHGLSGHELYGTWTNIKDRCFNPNNKNFHNYGGRGIALASEWVNDFEVFLSGVGERPGKNYSLDRIDNEGDYAPGNVKWSTQLEQSRNRRDNIWVEIDGVKMVLLDACDKLGIPSKTINNRMREGKTFEEAIANYKPRPWRRKNP